MRERDIELFLMNEMRKIGGLCWKWVSPGVAGVPDRICIFPRGTVWFVELKAPGKRPTPLQRQRMARLKETRANTTWLSTKTAVTKFIKENSV